MKCNNCPCDRQGYGEPWCVCACHFPGYEEAEPTPVPPEVALKAGLRKYGKHTEGCPGRRMSTAKAYGCTCGLDALLKEYAP